MARDIWIEENHGDITIDTPFGGMGFTRENAAYIYRQIGKLLGYPTKTEIKYLCNAADEVINEYWADSIIHSRGKIDRLTKWTERTKENIKQ